MDKLKPGCLYKDKCHPKRLYLMVDSNLDALEFGPIDASSYRYLECVKVTSKSLTEVNEKFRLFWGPFGGGPYACITWKLCITIDHLISSRDLEFLDMDGAFEYMIRDQYENGDSLPLWYNFDFLGSFYFEEGRLHYKSCEDDRTIFEKILNRKEMDGQV